MIDTSLLGLVELISEYIQHQLAVTISVDMAMCFIIQELLQLWGVDQVAVVGEADTIGTIDIEGLSFSIRTATSSRIS